MPLPPKFPRSLRITAGRCETYNSPAAFFVDELNVPASSDWRVARLIGPAPQLLFNGFAEFDVVPRHVRRDVAALEERQDPVDPSGMAFGFVPLGALRRSALSSRVCKLPGGFGFEGKNHNEAIAIDVDQ
jgi:hypothetical protein